MDESCVEADVLKPSVSGLDNDDSGGKPHPRFEMNRLKIKLNRRGV